MDLFYILVAALTNEINDRRRMYVGFDAVDQFTVESAVNLTNKVEAIKAIRGMTINCVQPDVFNWDCVTGNEMVRNMLKNAIRRVKLGPDHSFGLLEAKSWIDLINNNRHRS